MSWRWISKQALLLHAESLAEHGGGQGMRDERLLDSALAHPVNLAAYGEPDCAALAASYGVGVAKNHLFIDGNKAQLARDAASGQGETLDALAALLKVDAADKAAFVSLAKARHAEIFASVESADSIATRLKAALQSDARLAKYAEAV